MKKHLVISSLLLGSFSLVNAAPVIIFADNFSSYSSPHQPSTQVDTGDSVSYGGSLSGWTATGNNAIHAVSIPGARGTSTTAIMIYGNNVITSSTIAGSNIAGNVYTLSFDYGTANYGSEVQGSNVGGWNELFIGAYNDQGTQAFAMEINPGTWGAGNYNLDKGDLENYIYQGTGSGNLHFVVESFNPGSNIFAGEIANLSLANDSLVAASAPEPGSLALVGIGLAGWDSSNASR